MKITTSIKKYVFGYILIYLLQAIATIAAMHRFQNLLVE